MSLGIVKCSWGGGGGSHPTLRTAGVENKLYTGKRKAHISSSPPHCCVQVGIQYQRFDDDDDNDDIGDSSHRPYARQSLVLALLPP